MKKVLLNPEVVSVKDIDNDSLIGLVDKKKNKYIVVAINDSSDADEHYSFRIMNRNFIVSGETFFDAQSLVTDNLNRKFDVLLFDDREKLTSWLLC